MAISNPVAVYSAANNVEVHQLCHYLEQHGIEAHAIMDESIVGLWAFGTLAGIHKPQVWVDQSNAEAAKALFDQYDRDLHTRRGPSTSGSEDDLYSIAVICEECGEKSLFQESTRGTVQDCPHCGAFVDVGDDEIEWSDS
jgi:Putative prokaryotic signal transducing protein